MISIYQTKTLPKVLTFGQIKYYIFSLSFVSLAVFVPWALHHFRLAGPQFLPMHFFILIAGFLFGWRTGLFVGIISPLMSYSLTHMPPMAILPEVVLELAVYGLVIGFLAEKKYNIWVSLLAAMALGKLARVLYVLSFGLHTNPVNYIQTSWPGIVLQIALIPLIIFLVQKYIFSGRAENK